MLILKYYMWRCYGWFWYQFIPSNWKKSICWL